MGLLASLVRVGSTPSLFHEDSGAGWGFGDTNTSTATPAGNQCLIQPSFEAETVTVNGRFSA